MRTDTDQSVKQPSRWVDARFVRRPNRFLAVARLASGDEVAAHLPNTGRLTDLLVAGRRVVLRRERASGRATAFTLTRVWDEGWVSVEASAAPALLADWIEETGEVAPFGPVALIEREVQLERHRIDLRLQLADGRPALVEVKSGSRAAGGSAPLSGTPSKRAFDQLRALAGATADGVPTGCAFVVQRNDVGRLVVGGDADPGWIEAVRHARDAGVHIVAFGCRVTRTRCRIDRSLPVVYAD